MSKPLWVSNERGRFMMGFYIREEIFAVFFIIVLFSLLKDENITKKIKENISLQIAIVILLLYCIYNRIPFSFLFIILAILSFIFTDTLKSLKDAIFSQKKEENNENNIDLMKMGARVLNIIKPKSILKSPDKKVQFDVNNNSDSDSDSECEEAAKFLGLDDTDAETTDNETEEDKEKQKKDLLDFVSN